MCPIQIDYTFLPDGIKRVFEKRLYLNIQQGSVLYPASILVKTEVTKKVRKAIESTIRIYQVSELV